MSVQIKRRRWKPQFSLRILLLLTFTVSIGCVSLREYLLGRRPVAWRKFSQCLFDEHVQNGTPILVFYSARWRVESVFVDKNIFATPGVRRAIYTNRVLPLRISAPINNFHSLADREAMKSICQPEHPSPGVFAVCRRHNSSRCQMFDIRATPDEVVDAIYEASEGTLSRRLLSE